MVNTGKNSGSYTISSIISYTSIIPLLVILILVIMTVGTNVSIT